MSVLEYLEPSIKEHEQLLRKKISTLNKSLDMLNDKSTDFAESHYILIVMYSDMLKGLLRERVKYETN